MTRPIRPCSAFSLLAAGALIAALAAAAAGCGGGNDEDTLTKAEVIERGGAICREAQQRVEFSSIRGIDPPFAESTAAELSRVRDFLAGFADALEFSRDGLQELNAPEEDRELLDGYIEDIGTVVDKLRAASTADREEIEAIGDEAFELFEKASVQTAAYGFPKDVCRG